MKKLFFLIFSFLAFALIIKPAYAAPLPGAIFTTDSSCLGTDLNIYFSKNDVYLDGGPSHLGAAGLPDGTYYVQITDPSGTTLLGTSIGSGTDTPVTVSGGNFANCYQLSNILIKGSNSTVGYDDTPNLGGEYKVWVSNVATFDNNSTKTDNFKVKAPSTPTVGSASGSKWEDLNGDGIWQGGEPKLPNWTIDLWNSDHSSMITSALTDSNGDYSFENLTPATYQICEETQTGWTRTFPTNLDCQTIQVSAGQDIININFGNFHNITISGFKWLDLNQDKLVGQDELHLAGWTVFIDANGNGALDSGEQSTVTDVNGNYSFTNLGPNTNGYKVCEVMQYLWAPTYPTTSDLNCWTIIPTSGTDVTDANFGNYHGPTRTQGFWSTHTALTNANWSNVLAPNKQVDGGTISVSWCGNITGSTKTSPLTNTTGVASNQVMGGFWSNISKKTNGTNRSNLEKARMTLLQQLLAAILNKSTFNTNDGGNIALAESRYCRTNISDITSSTSLLDAYNSGGDIVPFPFGFNPGTATPTISQTQAYKSFWNNTL